MSWRDSNNPFVDSPPAYKENPSTDEDEERPILVDTSTKPKRSIAGIFCSIVFIFPYLSLFVTPFFVIGFFASTLNKAQTTESSGCILYATYDKSYFQLGHDQSCSFVIYGEVVIVLLSIGLLLASVIKCFVGRWFSPVLICDFVLLVLIFLTSLAISIVLSIGYGITCDSLLRSYNNNYESCSNVPFPYKLDFYIEHSLRDAMVSAWMVCCIAFVLLVVEGVVACCGCCLFLNSKKTTVSISAHDDFNDSRSSRY